MDNGERIAAGVGAAMAVLLQVVVAPHIALFAAVPNFMLAYALVIAVTRAQSCGLVMPFVLGLLFDLIGGGPVGACALLLVLATFLLSRASALVDNGTLFMPLAMLLVSSLAVELLYGVLLMACGMDVSPLQALVYRGLPCALYDAVIGLVMFPLVVRFVVRRGTQQPGTPTIL
ncbi:rod shape-determining protein MreD [Adlercreutzia sp. ZJ473]|uniref:rod shape-determining protein MreD n=1 Tax=Adlercreutzia sp. ZJ473 TaxID=2722822 RepID=UPI0015570C64|nr:rod shape-determining protein MreD [Adlercreutzia sp. ZJ473]